MIKIITCSAVLFFPLLLYSQDISSLREKLFIVNADTLFVDTLSMVPGTISVFDAQNNVMDTSLYSIYYGAGLMIFNKNTRPPEQIKVKYRVFPYSFSKTFQHKNIADVKPALKPAANPFTYTYQNTRQDFFKTGGLNKSGSIARGITLGNNQDVVVNSSLDLRLSGELSDNINIMAAITDDNIPIQPEGNTQQIQDFDKVFIQFYDEKSKLIAGDFILERPQSYFMNFLKKGQGGSFSTSGEKKGSGLPSNTYKVSASAAISKGKFSKHLFNGAEGNQGPYKLKGAENETFIIILSGTEKIYLDGELLERGQENDYIIDYNTAEIIFTPNRLITKDKRITAEFQYSERHYTRSLLHGGTEYHNNKLDLYMNLYSEQDAKNQPLLMELNEEEKMLLRDIGDNLDKAIVSRTDSVGYSETLILYEKKDSLGYTVYIYSTDPSKAAYQLSFSDVGQGKGNYAQANSVANGRVFQWKAPDTTSGSLVLQGRYEPVIKLITPKVKQMGTLGADYAFTKNTKLSAEIALSNNDINSFSSRDRSDDAGIAAKLNFSNTHPLTTSEEYPLLLTSSLNFEQRSKNFSHIERFRSVEFERDWSIINSTSLDEYLPGLSLGLSKKGLGGIRYGFNSFFRGNEYAAHKNGLDMDVNKNNFKVNFSGSYLQTKALTANTSFLRSKGTVSKSLKWFTSGISEEHEKHIQIAVDSDTLLSGSFEYFEWGAFVMNPDTAKNKFAISYKNRTDLAPDSTHLTKTTIGESVNLTVDLLKNPTNRFRGNITYRNLSIINEVKTASKPDNSVISRLEYDIKLLKGIITSNTFYEVGSGLEAKKEFSYLKVAKGQGTYDWIDYNDDGALQLNEFETAAFKSEAEYIRIFIPTDDYIKTFQNQFNEVLYLNPPAKWGKKKGIIKAASRLSNQAAYHIDRKTTNKNLLSSYNPFSSETLDSSLVLLNSSFRNIFYINRTDPKFGIELNYQEQKNKSLLVNDTGSRINMIQGIRLRWNISKIFMLNVLYNNGKRKNSSALFSSRNYLVVFDETEPRLTLQPNTTYRISISYKYTEKNNRQVFEGLGGERAINQKTGVEFKYNILSKGSLQAKAEYIHIEFKTADGASASANNSLAFEMLEGLQPGRNMVWNLTYNIGLSKNMQLNLSYDGRASEATNAVHTGSVQVRAYF